MGEAKLEASEKPLVDGQQGQLCRGGIQRFFLHVENSLLPFQIVSSPEYSIVEFSSSHAKPRDPRQCSE